MQTNKPLTSDYTDNNAPNGSILFARNRILTNGFTTSENEDGFTLDSVVEGDIVGAYKTQYGIVTISTNNVNGTNYFMIHVAGILYLRTKYIEWNPILATELVYQINANKELIIACWNGVDSNSNRPRIINLTKLPFTVDNNKEIVAENNGAVTAAMCADRTLLFATFKQPLITTTVDKTKHGSITQGRYACCIKYHVETGLTQSTIPTTLVDVINTKVENSTYHVYQQRNQTNTVAGHAWESFGKWDIQYTPDEPDAIVSAVINIELSNLDAKYKLFNLYIIKVTNDNKITIDSIDNLSVATTTNIVYNGTVSSTNVSSDGILTENLTFDKIQTGVILRNALYVYNTKKDNTINYQPYANNIKVGWDFKRDKQGNLIRVDKNNSGEQVVMPNEVYGFNIHLVYADGTLSDGFHIPGRKSANDELNTVDGGATYVDIKNSYNNYKKFHLNPDCAISDYNPLNTIVSNNNSGKACGRLPYWENETEDYVFTNTVNAQIWDVDSNGTGYYTSAVINDTGSTKVRHHRMPNLETIYKAGVFKNTHDSTITDVTTNPYPYVIEPVFYDIKIPNELLNDVVGYTISYIKKEFNDNLIAATAPLMRYKPINTHLGTDQAKPGIGSDDGSKAVLFDFTLQSKKPKLNINSIRVEHQITTGKDLGGYGMQILYNESVNSNMPIPTDSITQYVDFKLGTILNEPINNLRFGLDFVETSTTSAITGFNSGVRRNVKFLSTSEFEYVQFNNIVQDNQYRADSLKLKIDHPIFTTAYNVPKSLNNLGRRDCITFPQSSIYHAGTPEVMTHDAVSFVTGGYPIHFYQSPRRRYNTTIHDAHFETWDASGVGNYYTIASGHQYTYNAVEEFNDYTFCQRYYLVSLLNDVRDVHLNYRAKDSVLLCNVQPVDSNVNTYSTYSIQTVDGSDIFVTNIMKGDCYYNLYTMLFTDYNYDVQKPHDITAVNVVVNHNIYSIPIKIPGYSRMNPHYRYGEKATTPVNWIGGITNYNKDGYDLSFLKTSDFRVTNIYDDSLFKVLHYFNYIFKSKVSTGESKYIGWSEFSMVSSNNLPNFRIVDNTKGEGVALNATDKLLYIQATDSLFILQYRDKLTNNVVLDERDILEAPFEEFLPQDKVGKIGAMFRRCVALTPVGYFVIDFVSKTVHLVTDKYTDVGLTYKYNNELYKRLSELYDNATNHNLNLHIDDINKICTIGYDERLERIMFSLKCLQYTVPTYTPYSIIQSYTKHVDSISDITTTTTGPTTVTGSSTTTNTDIKTTDIERYIPDFVHLYPPTNGTFVSTSNSLTTTISHDITLNTTDSNNTVTTTKTDIHTYNTKVSTIHITATRATDTTGTIDEQLIATLSNLIIPNIDNTFIHYMYLQCISYDIGLIPLTLNAGNPIYLGYGSITNTIVDFLQNITPFYPIIGNVSTHSYNINSTNYIFIYLDSFTKIHVPINTIIFNNTVTFTPSGQLDSLININNITTVGSTLFSRLFEISKTLGTYSNLSKDTLFDGTYGTVSKTDSIYCGMITASTDAFVNFSDTHWTNLYYTVKQLFNVGDLLYKEDIYFDIYIRRYDSTTAELYVTAIYTERMKYNELNSIASGNTIHIDLTVDTKVLTEVTTAYVDTTETVETFTHTSTDTVITNNVDLLAVTLIYLQSFKHNSNSLGNYLLGYRTTVPTLPTIYSNGLKFEYRYEAYTEGGTTTYRIYLKSVKVQDLTTIFKYNTYSFMANLGIISKHDYYGNFYINNREVLNVLTAKELYIQNGNKLAMLPYVNNTFSYKPFYIDVVFNFNDTQYIVDSVQWIAKLFTVNSSSNTIEYTKSINTIMVYTDTQCSDLIELLANPTSWFDNTTPRYVNGEFKFNNFRDAVVVADNAIIDDDGVVYNSNHPSYNGVSNPTIIVNKNVKKWYENSIFMSKFAVVRFMLNPLNTDFKDKVLQLINVSLTLSSNNR